MTGLTQHLHHCTWARLTDNVRHRKPMLESGVGFLTAVGAVAFFANVDSAPSCICAGLLKSSALRGGARDVLPDERILAGFEIMAAPTAELLRYLYPNLYPISDPAGDWGRPTADGRYVPTTRLLAMP